MTDRPRFKSTAQHIAELATYAASHTREETGAMLASLPPAVQRKIREMYQATGPGMIRVPPRRQEDQADDG